MVHACHMHEAYRMSHNLLNTSLIHYGGRQWAFLACHVTHCHTQLAVFAERSGKTGGHGIGTHIQWSIPRQGGEQQTPRGRLSMVDFQWHFPQFHRCRRPWGNVLWDGIVPTAINYNMLHPIFFESVANLLTFLGYDCIIPSLWFTGFSPSDLWLSFPPWHCQTVTTHQALPAGGGGATQRLHRSLWSHTIQVRHRCPTWRFKVSCMHTHT